MAYYTNSEDVSAVLGANYDNINCPSLIPYIKSAQDTVLRMVQCATAKGHTFTSSELSNIAMWLAAYYYTINDPIYKAKTTGDASATYFDRSYLDAAKMLDTSGCLNSIVTNNRASMTWLGKPPSQQINYVDRD